MNCWKTMKKFMKEICKVCLIYLISKWFLIQLRPHWFGTVRWHMTLSTGHWQALNSIRLTSYCIVKLGDQIEGKCSIHHFCRGWNSFYQKDICKFPFKNKSLYRDVHGWSNKNLHKLPSSLWKIARKKVLVLWQLSADNTCNMRRHHFAN